MTKNYSHQTKVKTYHQVAHLLTKTKIIIKTYLVSIFLFLGLLATFFQVFTNSNPEDIQIARENHRKVREIRDQHRLDALGVLQEISENQLINDKYKNRISILLNESDKKEKQAFLLHQELKRVKASHKIRGFATLNSFLDGIGNPIFILMLGVVFAVLYFYGKQVQWKVVSKLYMLGLTSCVLVSTFYLYWALVPKVDIPRSYYLVVLFLASFITSFFVYKIVGFLFARSQKRLQEDEKISSTFNDFLEKEKNKK